MAATLPRQDSSGCLPKMADISSEDFRRYVQPAILEYNAKARELLRTHQLLVASQYETGLAKASREGSLNLGDLSEINPIASNGTKSVPSTA